MKKFVIKITDDGKHHLFMDDSSKDYFERIAQASSYQFVNTSCVIMKNDAEHFKTVFGIEKNELFQISISADAKIRLFEGVYAYCYDNIYYAVIVENAYAKIVPLGELVEQRLLCREISEYEMYNWQYFIDKQDNGKIMINFVIKNQVVQVGPYDYCRNVSLSSLLFCKREDGLYDIYEPNSAKALTGEFVTRDVYHLIDAVLLWKSDKQAWCLYENATRWGKNAMYTITKVAEKSRICLYKFTDENTVECVAVATGDFKIRVDYIKVRDTIYVLNKQGMVDFDNVKPFKKLRAFIAWLLWD